MYPQFRCTELTLRIEEVTRFKARARYTTAHAQKRKTTLPIVLFTQCVS